MRYTERDRGFFSQSVDLLAPQLLGKYLCIQKSDKGVSKFRITETEAYCAHDTASHSYKGRTDSNASMFMIGGTAYVFNCHGWQFNVVCNESGIGECVLIRGIEGYDGPVKLTRALGKTKESVVGKDLLSEQSFVWLESHDTQWKKYYKTDIRKLGEDKSADEHAINRRWRFLLI